MIRKSWSCLYDAFCIVSDKDLSEIGHDGSEIFWPDKPEPLCRRGFHIQEFIRLFYKFGLAIIEFEATMCMVPVIGCLPYEEHLPLDDLMKENNGVLIGEENGVRHALAWKNQKFIDINGIRNLRNYEIQSFYAIKSISTK